MYSSENVNIKPGQTKTYSLELKELPPGMPDPKEEHDVIVKLKTFRSDQLVQTLLAKWHYSDQIECEGIQFLTFATILCQTQGAQGHMTHKHPTEHAQTTGSSH